MDSIVHRLKKIVVQPKGQDDVDASDLIDKPAVAKYKAQNGVKSNYTEDPQVIRTLINSIPERFYVTNSEKVVEEEIIEFCSEREITRAQTRITKLAAHNKAVCRRIYQLVLEKQSQYQTELNDVLVLQQQNLEALNVCRAARSNISLAMNGLVHNRLTVVVNYRRKCRLERVKNSLYKIKTLQLSVEKMIQLIEEENFCKAIQLYRECQAVVDDFVHYVCLDKMRNKLKHIRITIEECLDKALMRMCEHFNPDSYSSLQKSFQLLGSGPSSIDQLQMHFASTVQNRSIQIIMQYCDKSNNGSLVDNTTYSTYCQMVPQLHFIKCILNLCAAMFEIIRCYHATINWHQKSVNVSSVSEEKNQESENTSSESVNWSESYQLERLLQNKSRLWTEIIGKVKLLIEQSQLNYSILELSDVMKLLSIVNKLTVIGLIFCDAQTSDLENAVRSKFQDFFRSYHVKRLERLKMFMENELWEICPVKRSFSFKDLAEFSSFQRYLEKKDVQVTESENEIDRNDADDLSLDKYNPFTENVFAESKGIEKESIMDNDIEGSEEKRLSRNISDEENQTYYNDGPIIANTTLEVCRLIGRYIEIMRLLKPIAVDIVNSLCQLYDYYLFSIYYIFFEYQLKNHSEIEIANPRYGNNRLAQVLRRIWDRLILHDDSPVSEKMMECRMDLPQPCALVFGEDDQVLWRAAVAVESIVYLGQTFLRDSLLDPISELLPESRRGLLRVFSEQNLLAGSHMRGPVFELALLIEFGRQGRQLVNHISQVNWIIRTVARNPSDYVNELQKILSDFQTRIARMSSSVPVSRELARQLWTVLVRSVLAPRLLEGYGSVTSCSPAGRNLMLVDWQSFVSSVQSCSGLNDLFEDNEVEQYIRAYFTGPNEMEDWINENKDRYSRTQLTNLIGLVTKQDKRLRQKLISLLLGDSANIS